MLFYILFDAAITYEKDKNLKIYNREDCSQIYVVKLPKYRVQKNNRF